ncbi:MAG: class I SAM-dependent methyltransferase [Chloroflexi bacterium]|nr:MAG: class I SAM-dependent methyltransferase [Chloroflexota bacterium]
MKSCVNQFACTTSGKYTDLSLIYSECSGPGGLRLTEFMAEKMQVRPGARLLDIGIERGYQTCFLAKEYGVLVTGIDPDDDRSDGIPHIEHLQRNAHAWGVEDRIMGLKLGVPDTRFAGSTFDFVHSTTTLEMVRGFFGVEYYRKCLAEIFRVLRPGGIFGLGEPMHRDIPIPADLLPTYTKGGGAGPEGWADCFATVAETVDLCRGAGFDVLEADHAPDAWDWWNEFIDNDPHCKADPQGEAKIIRQDGGRWLSYGYVIAQKPRE